MISVIITNFNGLKWLKDCFESLKTQTYGQFEIIFVDNGSTDNSVDFVLKNYPEVAVIKNKNNLGFSCANNIGFKKAKGEFIFLLNNDTKLESGALKNLADAFNSLPQAGAIQPKLVIMNSNQLDTCGSFWTNSSLLYHCGHLKSAQDNKYSQPYPVFAGKGAALMVKKSIVDKIGLFDDDFWCYYEDTDLCHRIWLSGYECWYWPKALVYHGLGGTSTKFDNSLIQFHNFKNKLLSFIKNFEAKTLIKIIPVYLALNVFLSFWWLVDGKIKNSLALCRALLWNIKNFPDTLKKRKKIQSFRQKTDKEIFKITKKSPRLSYYYYLLAEQLNKYED